MWLRWIVSGSSEVTISVMVLDRRYRHNYALIRKNGTQCFIVPGKNIWQHSVSGLVPQIVTQGQYRNQKIGSLFQFVSTKYFHPELERD